MTENNKWVACWGNATSITNRREAIYAKDLTLRYPIRMCFNGSMLRLRFSNLTGTEPVTLNKVFVGRTPVTFKNETSVTIMPGKETESDAVSYIVHRGDTIEVSFYLEDFTQMNSGTFVSGPLSKVTMPMETMPKPMNYPLTRAEAPTGSISSIPLIY